MADALATLREYRPLAPWGLRDLAALAGGILEAAGIAPLNTSATSRPGERTIRFYVVRGLVSPPDGRGTAAVYGYRHLLQVLAIKLRQMDGATLDALVGEFAGLTGDQIERRVAAALGPELPPPDRIPLLQALGTGRGKVGRAVLSWFTPVDEAGRQGASCRRIEVGPGVQLFMEESHPVLRAGTEPVAIADAIRQTLAGLVAPDPSAGRPFP